MNNLHTNIELGRKEVWRRLKLFFAAILFSLPLLMLVSGLLSYMGGNSTIIGFLLYGIMFTLLFKLYFWVNNVPCPNCGTKWGGKGTRGLNCISCGQSFKPDKNSDYSLSLKRIEFKYPNNNNS